LRAVLVAMTYQFPIHRGDNANRTTGVILRERDFFECCRKVPLITNELSARKWPKIQKNHRL
jgi:hypothetical protein